MAKSLTSHRPVLAVTLKLSALFLFTSMSALVKVLSEDFPPGELVFFRSLFAIPIIIIWLIARGEMAQGFVVKKPMGHFWRGVLGTTAMGLTFTGLSLLPLPEVTAIGYATPIFTLILAAVMLGERIRMIRIGAVALGLFGVLIMVWPRLGSTEMETAATIGALCVLAATIARSFVQIHIRQLVQVDHPAAIVFYFCVTGTLLSGLTAFWGWTMPTWEQATILIAVGLTGGVAQILVTSSYRFGYAGTLRLHHHAICHCYRLYLVRRTADNCHPDRGCTGDYGQRGGDLARTPTGAGTRQGAIRHRPQSVTLPFANFP